LNALPYGIRFSGDDFLLRLLLILLVLFVALAVTAKARQLIEKSKKPKKSDGKMGKGEGCEVYLPSSEEKKNANGALLCEQHADSSGNDRD